MNYKMLVMNKLFDKKNEIDDVLYIICLNASDLVTKVYDVEMSTGYNMFIMQVYMKSKNTNIYYC